MVDQRTGSESLRVRRHMDHMKRAHVLDQTYFHQVGGELTFPSDQWQSSTLCLTQAIPETPFTLSLAFPTNYNMAKVVGGTEVTMEALEGFCHLESTHLFDICSLTPS